MLAIREAKLKGEAACPTGQCRWPSDGGEGDQSPREIHVCRVRSGWTCETTVEQSGGNLDN